MIDLIDQVYKARQAYNEATDPDWSVWGTFKKRIKKLWGNYLKRVNSI